MEDINKKSISKQVSVQVKIRDTLIVMLCIGLLNLAFPDDPGFFKAFFFFSLYAILLISVYYGIQYAVLGWAFSSFFTFLLLPFLLSVLYQEAWTLQYWSVVGERSLRVFALESGGIAAFGLMRNFLVKRTDEIHEYLWKLRHDKDILVREVQALKTVNLELEQRISRQQDSLTTLFSGLQVLYSLNLDKALDFILELVRKFSNADRCSVWRHDLQSRTLIREACVGWSEAEKKRNRIPEEGSIEGWVLRNNMVFSVKLLLNYENLQKMDRGENIYTLPISAGRKIWGVLNIEEMPFEKFNLYTEKVLLMILALAAPALERILEYENLLEKTEMNPITGLPSFSNFHRFIENEMESVQRAGSETLFIILVEIRNFMQLVDEVGKTAVFKIVSELVEELKTITQNKARFFHYKEENQLALVYPHIDYDGVSLFSLEILEMVNVKEWVAADKRVIVGYSVFSGAEGNPEEVLMSAENLLELQKL